MHKVLILGSIIVCLLMLAATGLINYLSGEYGEGRVVRRAIEAHGGAGAIRSIKAGRIRGQGVRHGPLQEPAPFTWEESFEYPERYKLVIHPKESVTITYLAPAKKWWIVEGDSKPEEMKGGGVQPSSQLEPFRMLLQIEPQKTPTTLLDDDEVQFRPVTSLRADTQEMGQVIFSFDKAKGILLRVKGQIDRPDREPVKVERIYSNHKVVNGLLMPMKVTMHVNGRLDTEMTIDQVEFLDRLDAATFALP